MMYLITFYSQFESNQFYRTFSKLGEVVRKPVPRELSSSCGTCCTFRPAEEMANVESMNEQKEKENAVDLTLLRLFDDIEFERVYQVMEDNSSKKTKMIYTMIIEKE